MLKRGIFYLLCLLALTACTLPAERFSHVADSMGFYGFTVKTGQFAQQLYSNKPAQQMDATGVLHVYLDGDGTPWEQHHWIADDPTARNPLILQLMLQDKAPALFIGRPCYHGLNKIPACDPKYWTSHRYSQTVVDSMVEALKQYLQGSPYKQLVLIGYSGGGTLAVLMSAVLPEVKTILTLAANLDVTAWSEYHGYLPLSDSLNPAILSPITSAQQIHLAGLEDKAVPAAIIKAYAEKQANARYIPYAKFDHECCWVAEWPKILLLLN